MYFSVQTTQKVAISRGNLLNIDTFPRLIDIFFVSLPHNK